MDVKKLVVDMKSQSNAIKSLMLIRSTNEKNYQE